MTGGFNNRLKIWTLDHQTGVFQHKCTAPEIGTDINSLEWHPKGNLVVAGGKDNLIWVLSGLTGDFKMFISGHADEVTFATFTKLDGGKHVISSSADMTIRVWRLLGKPNDQGLLYNNLHVIHS